jgi:hypothetical protein
MMVLLGLNSSTGDLMDPMGSAFASAVRGAKKCALDVQNSRFAGSIGRD